MATVTVKVSEITDDGGERWCDLDVGGAFGLHHQLWEEPVDRDGTRMARFTYLVKPTAGPIYSDGTTVTSAWHASDVNAQQWTVDEDDTESICRIHHYVVDCAMAQSGYMAVESMEPLTL